MAGHQRMVPYGYATLQNLMKNVPVEYDIFSYAWNNQSESRDIPSHPHLLSTPDIIDKLGDRSVLMNQREYIEPIWRDYPLNDVIHYDLFAKFMGQILAFMLALEKWQPKLQEYDFIVRSRWDILVDQHSVNLMINNKNPKQFFTKSVTMYYGHPQISGDTIYGPRELWFSTLLPIDRSIKKIYAQSIIQHDRIRELKTKPLQHLDQKFIEYVLKNRWFSSHSIWGMLFQNDYISIDNAGESYPLGEGLLEVDPEHVNAGVVMVKGGR